MIELDFLSDGRWLVVLIVVFPVFPSISVGFCLHLVLAQALFFDLLKDNKLTKRKSSSQSWSVERRTKKKAEYVCRSSKYSQSTKRQYNCQTESTGAETSGKYNSGQISGKNSQPCYDDNK